MAEVTILEPISTGDVIDRAVRLYRRNFTPLVSIISVSSLLGYAVSMLFWFGMSEMEAVGQSGGSIGISVIFLLLGMMGYPVWFFTLLATIAGLSRVVGDHIMLDEPITFRACVAAIRRRLGAILVMGLLSIAVLIGAYFVLVIVMLALLMVFGLLAAVIGSGSLPYWVSAILGGVVGIAAVAAGIFVLLLVLARIAFWPQTVMIEGQAAGNALGRAMTLGAGNWHRIGAIVLFAYFISASVLAALLLPVGIGFYFLGYDLQAVITSPAGNALYTACGQLSNLIVLPIAIVATTLLYFDSRVRKEAYDLELLAHELSPEGYYQAVSTWQPMPPGGAERPYVQTSPLGLAGYSPGPQHPQANIQEHLAPPEQVGAMSLCRHCGNMLDAGARFCNRCGGPVTPENVEANV